MSQTMNALVIDKLNYTELKCIKRTSKVTGYGLEDWASIPRRDRTFFFRHRCVQTATGAHPASWYRGLLPCG